MHPIPSDTVRYSPAFCAFLLRYQVLYKVSDDLHEVPVLTDMGILPVHNILVCCSRLSQQKPYCHPRLSAIFSQRLCDCKVLTYNPPCFAEQNPSPLTRRGFSSLFCGAKSESFDEERIFLLVFRRKIRALWRGEDFPPCFCEKKLRLRRYAFKIAHPLRDEVYLTPWYHSNSYSFDFISHLSIFKIHLLICQINFNMKTRQYALMILNADNTLLLTHYKPN